MSAWADNPQAAQIDALIGRAGRLTSVECDRLTEAAVRARFEASAGAAAGDAAGVAARVAALVAAGVAAGDAARDAAWFAARVAAGAAARVAAGDAARDAAWFAADVVGALVVRDLIEEATPWNQAAYDVLTGPWRRVIGPMDLPAPSDETYLALHAMLPTEAEANEINFAMAEMRAAMRGSRRMAHEATPWNQEKYDLVTGPWRRIIGPVHPDDEVLV
jgi:hypothetical protein